MNKYDNFYNQTKPKRRSLWAERCCTARWCLRLIEFVLTAAFAGATVAWLAAGALLLLSTCASAEPITDTEVEQAWLHAFNECMYTYTLKGHEVPDAALICNEVADGFFIENDDG